MTPIIEAYGAGLFFPANAAALRSRIAQYVRAATPPPCRPKAIIVPHAGYDYSGPIAGSGYACLAPRADSIRRVILLGTCHVVRTTALLTTTAEAFQTPLGVVPVDTQAVQHIQRLPQVAVDNMAHRNDHALAVQLPMLQCMLPSPAHDFRIVPLLVGTCETAAVAAVLEDLWDGDETLIVVSSDLSHYLRYQEARQRDQATADAIMRLDDQAIGPLDACGQQAIAGLLVVARHRHLHAYQIDLRNSGDTGGSRDAVVGYGAFALAE